MLEDRSVPAITFTPNTFGGGSFTPFSNYDGPISFTSADVNGDAVADIIVSEGYGPGSSSEVRIFDGAAARAGRADLIADFYAYSNVAGASQTPGFAGGVSVAAADFNGTGPAEVVTSAGVGGNGHVKVWNFHDPVTGQFLGSSPVLETSFLSYPGFLGQTSVTTLSQGSGSTPLLVTASGAGTTASDVRAYADPTAIGQVPAGAPVAVVARTTVFPGYLGGVSIASGDTTGTGTNELFIAPSTGTPEVSTFTLGSSGTGGTEFLPGITFSTGTGTESGITLGAADINGTGYADVLTSFAGSSTISAYSLNNGAAVPVTGLSGFTTGFGFFGNTFLAASTFFPPSLSSGISSTGTSTSLGLTGTGTTSTTGTGTAVGGTTGAGAGTPTNPGSGAGTGTGSGSGGSTTGTPTTPGGGSATGGTSSAQNNSVTNTTNY
ncbi:hypothetical protein [Frigoriglobus tundricola]|nr:hypothetical protein [Frigoriglobus tundricola]